jgi:hypothetical protein
MGHALPPWQNSAPSQQQSCTGDDRLSFSGKSGKLPVIMADSLLKYRSVCDISGMEMRNFPDEAGAGC